ncbi:MAG: C39 family peptidase [Alphaproteobacteria bacterium]|nr:C39 family peptidase [Alphaproteobacteria bacterium]
MMVLRFYGMKRVTFADINRYTKFKRNGYSFFSSGISYILAQGLGVTLIESFDYRKFAEKGVSYMKSTIDRGVFEEFNKHIDLPFESQMMKKNFTNKHFRYIHRRATLKDVEYFIAKNIPVITSVNPNRLEGRSSYGSHAVVILSITSKTVTFHDPGLPAIKKATVSRALFRKAFTDADPDTSNIIAVYPI